MEEKRLNQRQETAAQLLAIGNLNKTEICGKVGISRTTLWQWENSDFFIAEVNRIKLEQENFGTTLFRNALIDAVNNIKEIANKSPNETARLKANIEIIDRIYGKAATSMNVTTDNQDKSNTHDEDDIKEVFKSLEDDEDYVQ